MGWIACLVRAVHGRWPVEAAEDAEDRSFDDQLPMRLRLHSPMHFTPVAVARHAARLLAPCAGMVVLDVGAGAGKFCVTAAREVPAAMFVGVEWRPHLAHVAMRIARHCELANVRFVIADAFDLDWSTYDAFYFFNPFAEQCDSAFVLDQTVELDAGNFALFASETQRRLAGARSGTRIVTYHGFGASPPLGYELATEDQVGSDRLELWIKTQTARP
jgi:methyltransferase family protein